jgi:RNA polymerase sigma-70 factor (ECF subfamily)
MNFKEFTGSIDVVREKLLRYALWVTGTRGEAEDIVQETFIRMWKMKKKLHEYDNLENLGKRIIKNLSIDIFRSRRKFIDIDSAAFNPIKSPEEEMINNENFTKLKNIIRNLGEPYHTVLYLRAIEGRDIKEISKIINAKHNTVEVILSRARKKIREEYKMMDYGNKIK